MSTTALEAAQYARFYSPLAAHWGLDPAVLFLNHGSFGACPTTVLQAQQRLRTQMEAEPVRFFLREAPALLTRAREAVAALVGADPEGLVFVDNATTGVNTALSVLPLRSGDRLLTTDHAYNACRNALDVICARTGAAVDVVSLPRLLTAEGIIDAVLGAITPRTRFALIDHITSVTAAVMPVAPLVAALAARGVEVIIDGAHAPGQIDVDVLDLDVAFYTGNLHKWVCGPKSAAFLWVREDWRDQTRPLVTSHGHNTATDKRAAFHACFDWTGTTDPSPAFCAPTAITTLSNLLPGGLDALRARNHDVAVQWQDALVRGLRAEPITADTALGAMACVRLPAITASLPASTSPFIHPLQDLLWHQHAIEVPVMKGPCGGDLLRVSAQVYSDRDAIAPLIDALRPLLG